MIKSSTKTPDRESKAVVPVHGAGKVYPQKPGDKALPGAGRPKGSRNRKTIIKEILDLTKRMKNPVTGKIHEMTVEQQIIFAIANKALKGDVKAYEALSDRVYGKPEQMVENINKNIEMGVEAPGSLFPEKNIVEANSVLKNKE